MNEKIICKECGTKNTIDPKYTYCNKNIVRACIACGYCLDCGKWNTEDCKTCQDANVDCDKCKNVLCDFYFE